MFISKKKLLFISIFSLIFATTLSAYSSYYDNYGIAKFGTYHCVKNGKTCEIKRYGSSSSYVGKACPPYIEGEKKSYEAKIVDFINSQHCTFEPPKTKKYECRYDNGGYAIVYVDNGQVNSVNSNSNIDKKDLQSFYEPDKCVEKPLQENNGERPNTPDSSNNPSFDNSNDSGYTPYTPSYDPNLNKDTIEQSVKKETESLNQQIKSLQNEIDILKKEIHSLEQYVNYMIVFLVIIFAISLIALLKSINNPYNRL